MLLLHGFGGSPHDFRPLIDALPKEYTIRAPILPGHGVHSPRALETVSPQEWQAFVQREMALMEAHHERIIVCGFSLGGLLALDEAVLHKADTTLLINPYVGPPRRAWHLLAPSAWIDLAAPVIPYIKKLKSGQINCPEGVSAYEPGYWHLSMRALQALNRYSRYVQSNALYDGENVYVHISHEDIVSDPVRMQQWVLDIGIDAMNISVWSNANHVLLYDYDAKEAIVTMIQQIMSRVASGVGGSIGEPRLSPTKSQITNGDALL